MAQDDGLEGLDEFGTDSGDFGDQINDFMESDLGKGDGGGDGDSELDSFFEDLSTIDDLEVKAEEAPAPEPMAAEPEAEEPEPEPESEPEPGEKKPMLIPAIISSVIGIVLGLITVGGLYWYNRPTTTTTTTTLPTTTLETSTVPSTTLPPPPPTTIAPPTTLPPAPAKLPVAPRPKPPKPNNFFVQVANCIYQECVDDYRFLLKRHGYATNIATVTENAPMTEILSRQTFGGEEAAKWVRRINQENQLTGEAFRKASSGGKYLISLGLFPDLQTATKVKMHLNQLYAAQINFEAKQASQAVKYQKVRIGGFASREEALRIQEELATKDKRLQGAFVIHQVIGE